MFSADARGLILALVVNTTVGTAAYRFVRRRGGNDVGAIVDTLLLVFLIQYVSIGVPGLFGFLKPVVVSTLALAVSVALVLWPARTGATPLQTTVPLRPPCWMFRTAGLFVLGFALAIIWLQRALPPMANDALTYHLPAAVKWIQDGRISVLETWFYNPANAYSPLAGSVWAAWWMLPTHDDTLARFVQLWPWLGLFAGVVGLARALIAVRWNGAEDQPRATAIACLTGVALVLSRPFVSQVTLGKDDLFVAFFFVSVVSALTRKRVTEPSAPWRVGVGLGLFLATKYTTLLSLPVLLLMIDAPWRAGWRWKQWGVVAGCVLLLAGPWYLRNAVAYGNPLYPQRVSIFGHELLPGLIDLSRSGNLTTWPGVRATLIGSYYSLPMVVAVCGGVGWLVTACSFGRRVVREPLVRLVVVGAVTGLVLFVARAPYAEIRFVYPSLILLFVGAGVAGRSLGARWGVVGVTVLAGVCVATGYNATGSEGVAELVRTFILAGAALAAAGAGAARLPRRYRAGGLSLALVVAIVVLIHRWDAYVQGYRAAEVETWQTQYDPLAGAWQALNAVVPPNATLAYTNTYLLHPLYGPTLGRRLVYAPVRADVNRLHDVPPVKESVGGEQMIPYVVRQLTNNADEHVWLDHLRSSGATHLLVVAGQHALLLQDHPIELDWARARPATFKPVASVVGTALVFEIHW